VRNSALALIIIISFWADALLMNTVFRILMKQQRLAKHRMLFFSVR